MKALILLVIPFSVFSQKMNPAELVAWYNSDNYPLKYQVTKNGVVFTLRATTPEVIVARQLLKGDIGQEEAKDLLKKSREVSSYELVIELPVSKDIYTYESTGTIALSERAHYWAFDCIHDFSVVADGGEQFGCGFVLTEKGISGYPTSVISLDFPVYLSHTSSITFLDKALTGSLIVFEIPETLTYKQPKLKL